MCFAVLSDNERKIGWHYIAVKLLASQDYENICSNIFQRISCLKSRLLRIRPVCQNLSEKYAAGVWQQQNVYCCVLNITRLNPSYPTVADNQLKYVLYIRTKKKWMIHEQVLPTVFTFIPAVISHILLYFFQPSKFQLVCCWLNLVWLDCTP